jgi:hypothetical protein
MRADSVSTQISSPGALSGGPHAIALREPRVAPDTVMGTSRLRSP